MARTHFVRGDNGQPNDGRRSTIDLDDLAVGDGEAVFFEFRDKENEGKKIGKTDAAAAENTRFFEFGDDAVGDDTAGLIVEGFNLEEGDVLKFARVRDFDGSLGVVNDEEDFQQMVDKYFVENVDTDGDGDTDSAYFNVGGYDFALEDYLF